MTVSSLAASSVSSPQSPGANPVAQDWKNLQGAISQGNNPSAQTAFNSLVSNLSKSPTGSPAANSPVGKALSQLGSDIKNGDLNSARSDFATLRTAVRSHHLHSGSSAPNYSSSANSSGGDNSVTSVVVPPYGSAGRSLNVLA